MSRTTAADTTPRSSTLRYGLVAVVFLALGVGAAAAFNAFSTRPDAAPAAAAATTDATDAAPPAATPVRQETIEAPAGPAKTPKDAVAQFLAAEQSGDFATSYELLAQQSREVIGSASQWVAAHADLPGITGWQLDAVQGDDTAARVIGTVGFAPVLDEVAGLIPASASATWQVVAEGDVWRVDYESSELLPRYPDDATADDAVAQWVSAAQRCEQGPQYDGGLLGRKALAASLCDVDGEPQTSQPRPLDAFELDVLLPPFGAEAEIWARAVDVTAPVPLRALVAPLGDDWIVVAVLEPSPS